MLSSVPEPCACTYSVNQHRCFASDFTHFIKLINQLVKIKLFRIEYRISNSMQTSLIQAQIHNSVCLTFILFIYIFLQMADGARSKMWDYFTKDPKDKHLLYLYRLCQSGIRQLQTEKIQPDCGHTLK